MIKRKFNKGTSPGQSLPLCYKSNVFWSSMVLRSRCILDHTIVTQVLNCISSTTPLKMDLHKEMFIVLALSFLSNNVTILVWKGP